MVNIKANLVRVTINNRPAPEIAHAEFVKATRCGGHALLDPSRGSKLRIARLEATAERKRHQNQANNQREPSTNHNCHPAMPLQRAMTLSIT